MKNRKNEREIVMSAISRTLGEELSVAVVVDTFREDVGELRGWSGRSIPTSIVVEYCQRVDGRSYLLPRFVVGDLVWYQAGEMPREILVVEAVTIQRCLYAPHVRLKAKKVPGSTSGQLWGAEGHQRYFELVGEHSIGDVAGEGVYLRLD